jgi:Heterokaryon incompatibility protein (HET)
MTTLPSDLQTIVAANSAIYQAPLTEKLVRIVQLHPGIENEPISCSFAVVDLAQAGSFEALSYCWGSEAAEKPIFCNGKPFKPTKNLFAALKQLRSASRLRYIWIDAVWWPLYPRVQTMANHVSLIRSALTRTAPSRGTSRCR